MHTTMPFASFFASEPSELWVDLPFQMTVSERDL